MIMIMLCFIFDVIFSLLFIFMVVSNAVIIEQHNNDVIEKNHDNIIKNKKKKQKLSANIDNNLPRGSKNINFSSTRKNNM